MLDHSYSQTFDSRGQFCGKIKSVIFKVFKKLINIKNNFLKYNLSMQLAPIRVTFVVVFLVFSI